MQETVFTKIRHGEIPAEFIYKDDVCFVILTIEPFSPGHLLVIPNDQVDHLWDLSDDTYHHLFDVAKTMAYAIRKAYTYKRVDLLVEGFEMPHAHLHVVGLDQSVTRLTWDHHQATPEELKTEADKLRACL